MSNISRARRDYTLLLTAALAWGSTISQLAMLSVVLRNHGMTPSQIAFVLSAMFVTMAPATLLSGTLTTRFGPVRTMMWATALSGATLVVFPFALDSVPMTTLLAIGRGLAAGLFIPSGQAFAQAQAAEGDSSRMIGMFTAMLLIPSFYSPALGQWALRALGEPAFFGLAALPMIGTVAILCLLHPTAAAPPRASGYLTLLRDRRLWLPNLATMQSGIAYAFAYSFLPLLLSERGRVVALFFTPFSVVLLLVRFAGLKYLQRLPPPAVIGLGLLAYAAGLCILIAPAALAVLVAAVLFAVGYGVMLPTCVAWATSYYPRTERARPVALVNTSFNVGSIAAVQAAGALLPAIGWTGVLLVLAIPVLLVFSIVALNAAQSAISAPSRPLEAPDVSSPR